MLRVQYDSSSGDILGYYPTNINYNNVDVEAQTIDGNPYIQIPEIKKNLHKQMEVKNGVYQERIKDPSVIRADLLAQQIQNIKGEAHTRITAIYPITKQLNLIYEQADKQTEYTSMVEFIANIRVKSNELESQLSGMSIDELSVFDCSDDQYWQ